MKKLFFLFSAIILLLFLGVNLPIANGLTVNEQINAIQKQIADLQLQLLSANTEPVATPYSIKYIKLLSPNGGESISLGANLSIKWEGEGLSTNSSNIEIELWRGGFFYQDIIPNGFGFVNKQAVAYWTPKNLPADSSYKIKVTDLGLNKSDESDSYFSIGKEQLVCKDTDFGKDYYVSGIVSRSSYSTSDFCSSQNTLVEYYCVSDGSIGMETKVCENGCDVIKGVCKTGQIGSSCSDTDGGLSYYVKGTACSGAKCIEDVCLNQNTLNEASCANSNGLGSSSYYCPNGCAFGACSYKDNIQPAVTSIAVVYPNGGEYLFNGNTYTIRWKGANLGIDSSKIRVELWKNNLLYSVISTPAVGLSPTEGSAYWTFANIPAGDTYRIKVIDTGKNVEAMSSNNFNIDMMKISQDTQKANLAAIADAISQIAAKIRELMNR